MKRVIRQKFDFNNGNDPEAWPGPVDDGVEHGVDHGQQLGDPGEVVEGLVNE